MLHFLSIYLVPATALDMGIRQLYCSCVSILSPCPSPSSSLPTMTRNSPFTHKPASLDSLVKSGMDIAGNQQILVEGVNWRIQIFRFLRPSAHDTQRNSHWSPSRVLQSCPHHHLESGRNSFLDEPHTDLHQGAE